MKPCKLLGPRLGENWGVGLVKLQVGGLGFRGLRCDKDMLALMELGSLFTNSEL